MVQAVRKLAMSTARFFFTSSWVGFGRTTSNTTRFQQAKGNRPKAVLECYMANLGSSHSAWFHKKTVSNIVIPGIKVKVKMLNTGSSAQAYKLPFYYYLFIFFLFAHSTSEDISLTEKHVLLKFVRVFKIPLSSKRGLLHLLRAAYRIKEFF